MHDVCRTLQGGRACVRQIAGWFGARRTVKSGNCDGSRFTLSSHATQYKICLQRVILQSSEVQGLCESQQADVISHPPFHQSLQSSSGSIAIALLLQAPDMCSVVAAERARACSGTADGILQQYSRCHSWHSLILRTSWPLRQTRRVWASGQGSLAGVVAGGSTAVRLQAAQMAIRCPAPRWSSRGRAAR